MRVVALISGGKDSCFNMMQCISEGHEVVALANLKPQNKDELDSYMYQTVGHQAIDLYADAMQLPLYRREIKGQPIQLSADYQETKDDEVEDLYKLLLQIKDELDINAVAVGAILSDYQRVRVENVCSRLGLTALAYLWRRNQAELLAEMIACQVDAIVIKVAALGLTPKDHLGKTIGELYPHLLKMLFYKKRYVVCSIESFEAFLKLSRFYSVELDSGVYGLNVCGEGGEYETFTLDCPLFFKRIVVDEFETVLHSDDAFAPVAYLNLKRMHLEDKHIKQSQREHLLQLPSKHSRHLVSELFSNEYKEDDTQEDTTPFKSISEPLQNRLEMCNSSSSETDLQAHRSVKRTPDGYVWMSGFAAHCVNNDSIEDCVKTVLDELIDTLSKENLGARDLVAIHLYISNMKDFAAINNVYRRYFCSNPPIRVCVEVPLARNIPVALDCVAFDGQLRGLERRVMHVQGISHWAPANIGPYSQAIMVGLQVFVAGQIALCPATMTMIESGARPEARLSLRHVDRVLKAMNSRLGLSCVTLAICYVTGVSIMSTAHEELKRFLELESVEISNSELPFVAYIHVPTLPRQAQIEWHVVAVLSEDNQKDSVETSVIKDSVTFKVHARKQWTSEETFVLPFIISVEKVIEDKMEILLEILLYNLLCQLADLLKKQSCSWESLHCLRLFYAAEKCSHSNLQSGLDSLNVFLLVYDKSFSLSRLLIHKHYSCPESAYNTAFCRIFESSKSENATAFIPIVGFQSPNCLMTLCHS